MKIRWMAVGCLFLTGCVVQSFHPFFTEDARVEVPQYVGQWDFVDKSGGVDTNKIVKPWTFELDGPMQYELSLYDDKGTPGKLKATFFKVAGQLFCDFAADDPDDRVMNAYWLFHVRPVHSVAKVETEGGRLFLTPLNFDWFKKAVEARKTTVPYIKREGSDDYLFTATPAQWSEFLAKFGTDTNAFDRTDAYVLKKQTDNLPEKTP